jgi:hypothetical protein
VTWSFERLWAVAPGPDNNRHFCLLKGTALLRREGLTDVIGLAGRDLLGAPSVNE